MSITDIIELGMVYEDYTYRSCFTIDNVVKYLDHIKGFYLHYKEGSLWYQTYFCKKKSPFLNLQNLYIHIYVGSHQIFYFEMCSKEQKIPYFSAFRSARFRGWRERK